MEYVEVLIPPSILPHSTKIHCSGDSLPLIEPSNSTPVFDATDLEMKKSSLWDQETTFMDPGVHPYRLPTLSEPKSSEFSLIRLLHGEITQKVMNTMSELRFRPLWGTDILAVREQLYITPEIIPMEPLHKSFGPLPNLLPCTMKFVREPEEQVVSLDILEEWWFKVRRTMELAYQETC